jgi:hypothetical protein
MGMLISSMPRKTVMRSVEATSSIIPEVASSSSA